MGWGWGDDLRYPVMRNPAPSPVTCGKEATERSRDAKTHPSGKGKREEAERQGKKEKKTSDKVAGEWVGAG